ncbi:MAG: PAS domain S-box protein [Chitinophagaceae bacterium]|nr:MAG: PAS domain S-box protein [Chitinophagaceae bacterium]
MRRSVIPKTNRQAEVLDISGSILSSLGGAIICADMDGVIIHFNPAAEKIFGVGTAEICGKSIDELLTSCSASQLTRLAASAFHANEPRKKSIRIETKEGTAARVSINIAPLRDDQNQVTGFCAYAEVVPFKKTLGRVPAAEPHQTFIEAFGAEERIRRNEKRFRSIVENSADGIAVLLADGSPTYLSPSIKNILGYDEVAAMGMNLFSATHPDDVASLEKLWARVLASPGVPIRAYPCRIRHNDGSWRVFDGTFTNLLHDPAVCGIVDNFRDVTEMVEAEEKLKSSEERYRYLFHNNPLPMWIFDPRTFKFLAVNRATTLQYGYSVEEFSQLSVLDIRTKESAAAFLAAVTGQHDAVHRKAGEFEHMTRDGRIIYVDIVSHLIQYEGVEALLVLAKDITEQKHANQLLFKSYKENNRMIESIGDGFFSLDKDYNVTYWNKAAEEIVKMPRAKVLGKCLWHSFETARQLKFPGEYRRAFRDQVTVSFEEYYPELDLWLDVTAYPWDSGLSVFFRDITVKKRSIDSMRQVNDRFNMIARITNDAIYEWDIQKNVMYWGEGYSTLFGHPWVAGKKMPLESWRDNVHPTERDSLIQVAQDAFRDKVSNITRELRFRCADGSYKLVYDKLAIVYAEDGKPLRLMGAMQDITEKRMMETSLQNAKNRQQRAITRATIQGQEKEREQIGIELHDNINQILATASLYVEHGLSPEAIKPDIISQGKDMIQLATREIRKLSHALLPPSAGDFGLINSLNDLAAGINMTDKFTVHANFKRFDESVLPREQKLTIYRIAQEQMNNILKHAQCTSVRISLRLLKESNMTELVIADNGKGFNVLQKKNGVGLRNIVGRAELFCGKVDIVTSPGNGCRLTVTLPAGATGGEDCSAIK